MGLSVRDVENQISGRKMIHFGGGNVSGRLKWIRASGYPLADIPVLGGLFFEYGSLFTHIFEVGTDEGSKC